MTYARIINIVTDEFVDKKVHRILFIGGVATPDFNRVNSRSVRCLVRRAARSCSGFAMEHEPGGIETTDRNRRSTIPVSHDPIFLIESVVWPLINIDRRDRGIWTLPALPF